MNPSLRRDFIPNMVKMEARQAVRSVRRNSMNVDDLLRIQGCHLTQDDITWLNTPGAKYTVMKCEPMGDRKSVV